MANPFNRLEALTREFQRYNSTKKVVPALRIGDRFIPIETAYIELSRRKIRFISWYLGTKGVRVKKSNSSESIYFYMNGQSFRVSDHFSYNADHIQHHYIVKFDTCVVQVWAWIKLAQLKLDHYYG
jgi:hypothetical protein